MLRKWSKAAALLAACFATGSVAAEVEAGPAPIDSSANPMAVVGALFVGQLPMAAYSWLLTKEPVGVGVATFVLAPLAGSENLSYAGNVASTSAYASIGAYNAIVLSRDEYTDAETFRQNMYGLNAGLAFTFLVDAAFGEPVAKNVTVQPADRGLMLTFRSSF